MTPFAKTARSGLVAKPPHNTVAPFLALTSLASFNAMRLGCVAQHRRAQPICAMSRMGALLRVRTDIARQVIIVFPATPCAA